MGISQATSAVMVFLTGLLPASCHKTSAQQQRQQPHQQPPAAIASVTNAPVKTPQWNLGEISMTNKSELYVQFENGDLCTLTPKILDRNNVRITFALESKNAYGETRDFTIKQVVANPGQPLEVAFGELKLAFIPHIVESSE